jgi:broad specificity phosphatase PhoE
VLTDTRLDYPDGDVVIVTHQAVAMLFRYVLDQLTEAELLDLDNRELIANTGVTTYTRHGDELRLVTFNDSSHLPIEETTAASDRSAAPR